MLNRLQNVQVVTDRKKCKIAMYKLPLIKLLRGYISYFREEGYKIRRLSESMIEIYMEV
jgi:hypothetical protein